MITLIFLFIFLQTILLFVMALHDWVHLPPLTDIRALEKHHSKNERLRDAIINSLMVAIPLWFTYRYHLHAYTGVIALFYGVLTLGTICAWWIPYVFGSSQKHKEGFVEYKNTHHFLPKRGDNVVPNTFHFMLHVLVWTCFVLALYAWLF